MKKFSIFLCAVTAIAALACNKEIQEIPENPEPQTPQVELFPMTFTATTADTRTGLDNDYEHVLWADGEKISVFDGAGNQEFTSGGAGRKVTFSGNAAQANVYYALYPHDGSAQLSGTSVMTTLASAQTPRNGSFADGLNINAAQSTDKTTFVFDNVLSVAKFTLDATKLGGKTIKSVKFASKSYPLAGSVAINFGETCTAEPGTAETFKEVSMTDANGLADGTYFLLVLPNAGGEITMTFESTDGYVARKTATLNSAFTAGHIKNLGTVQGLVWTKVFFYESFDQCEGTGGNDGKWNDISATYSLVTDNSGWTFNKGNGADKCARLGSTSNKGTATTPSLALPGTVTLSFRAGAWDGGSESLILMLSATGATIDESVTMQKAAFTDYDLTLSEVTTSTSITFAGKNKSNSRFFLDEVLIYVGDKALAYELVGVEVEPETVSAPTFDPNGGEFNTAQNVTITSTTEGATIYYTTDGTDPTTSTTTMVTNGGTVSISTSCTLKAIAAKDGVSSAVSSAVFTINSGSTNPSPVSFSPSDFEGQGNSGSGGDISVVKTPITVFSNMGYCKAGDNYVRVYSGGMIEISASGNKKITKIVFTFSGSNYGAGGLSIPSTQDGDYTTSNGTWTYFTGASSVLFNAKAQVRFTSIEVTYK